MITGMIVVIGTSFVASAGVTADPHPSLEGAERHHDINTAVMSVDRAGEASRVDAASDRRSTGEIDESLQQGNETEIEVVVRLEPADASTATSENDAVDLLKHQSEESQGEFLALVEDTASVTAENDFWIANAVLVTVDLEAAEKEVIDPLEEMVARPNVVQLHENFEVESAPVESKAIDFDDPADGALATESVPEDVTYGLEMLNVPEVWDQHDTMGEGVAVAVLDTDVDVDHPDLDLDEDNWQEFDEDDAPVASESHDGDGHGTHVSGTVIGPVEPAGDDRTGDVLVTIRAHR